MYIGLEVSEVVPFIFILFCLGVFVLVWFGVCRGDLKWCSIVSKQTKRK
jgi:hypothetical protein